jgi:hypothetical protein
MWRDVEVMLTDFVVVLRCGGVAVEVVVVVTVLVEG